MLELKVDLFGIILKGFQFEHEKKTSIEVERFGLVLKGIIWTQKKRLNRGSHAVTTVVRLGLSGKDQDVISVSHDIVKDQELN